MRKVGSVGLPHQAKDRRPRHREIHIAQTRRDQLRRRVLVGHRLTRGLGREELPEPIRRKRRQQALRVAEVMRRGGMADPCPLGDRPQRERLHPPLGQLGLGRRKQRRAQIAMVIGARCGAGRGLQSGWINAHGITQYRPI